MRSQRFAVGAARRRTSSSAFDSKKRSRSTVSTMYTTASTCWKYSDHTFRATVCPPRSNVRNLMLPMVSSSIAAQHTGRGLAPCARRAPPRSAPRPAGRTHLDAASGCAARCGHPSAGAGAWSCLHCPGRGTGSSRFCGRDLRAAVPVRGGWGGCSTAAPRPEAGGPCPRLLWQPRAPRGRQPRPTRGEGGLRRTQRAEHVPHPREHPHAGPAPPTRRGRLSPRASASPLRLGEAVYREATNGATSQVAGCDDAICHAPFCEVGLGLVKRFARYRYARAHSTTMS